MIGDLVNKKLLFCVSFVLFACTSAPRHPTEERDVPTRAVAAIPVARLQDPSLTDVLNVLRSARASTVDEALRALGRAYPDFMTEHVLVYDSFSIQKSDYLKPRAIVYGQTGRTIVTFNDAAASGGRGAIETSSFVEGRGNEFREIAFTAETPRDERLAKTDIDRALSDQRMLVSRANIGKCTQCHTNNLTIWENYPVWPGVYGSYDDGLFREPGFGSTFVPEGVNVEAAKYDEYLRTRTGRYLNLPPRPRSQYRESDFADYSHRPNLNLSRLLARQTFENFAYALVKAKPVEAKLKRLLASLTCRFHDPLQEELWWTMHELGPAVLENVRRMQALYAPATFTANPYRVKDDMPMLRLALPGVTENDLNLIANIADFRETAQFTHRARACGVDAHLAFGNRSRTANNGAGAPGLLFDTLISVLIRTGYPGDWARYAAALTSDNDERACAMAQEI